MQCIYPTLEMYIQLRRHGIHVQVNDIKGIHQSEGPRAQWIFMQVQELRIEVMLILSL